MAKSNFPKVNKRLRPDGATWQIYYTTPARESSDGKRHQVSEEHPGPEEDAETRRQQIQLSLRTGSGTEMVTAPMEKVFADFLRVGLRGKSFRTVQYHESNFRLHLREALGGVSLCDLTSYQVDCLYAQAYEDKVPEYSIFCWDVTLRRFFNWVMEKKWLVENPMASVSKPTYREPEIVALTPEEVNAILRALLGRHRVFYLAVHLAAYLGLRRGEVLGLPWRFINFSEDELSVFQAMIGLGGGEVKYVDPKGKSRRTLEFSDATRQLLLKTLAFFEEAVAEGRLAKVPELVCARDDGGIYNPDSFSSSFRKVQKSHGLVTVNFHRFRHTCATIAIEEGDSPRDVQLQLGHSDPAFTMENYVHPVAGHFRRTANRVAGAYGGLLTKC